MSYCHISTKLFRRLKRSITGIKNRHHWRRAAIIRPLERGQDDAFIAIGHIVGSLAAVTHGVVLLIIGAWGKKPSIGSRQDIVSAERPCRRVRHIGDDFTDHLNFVATLF